MNFQKKRILVAIAASICGSIIMFSISYLNSSNTEYRIKAALIGAGIGAAMASGVIGSVGRAMLCGALVFGLVFYLVSDKGERGAFAVLAGVIVGAVSGLVYGASRAPQKPSIDHDTDEKELL